MTRINVKVDGVDHSDEVEPRMLLVQYLRERLGKTGTVIGCDTSNCGACTVHFDGRSVKSCNMLAVQADGHEVTTIEGLAAPDGALHPMQEAFIEHDAFQCGYCTPGQLCSAIGMLDEAKQGYPSHVTEDLDPSSSGDASPLADDEIRERMSGNLCRCAAYPNILAAIRQAADR